MNWWQLLLAGVGGGGLAGVATTLIGGLLNRPAVRADAVVKLTESALRQVDELQERAESAEQRAAAAEQAADQARAKVRLISDELDVLLARLRLWRTAILATPDVPEPIRQMVADPGPQVNGHRM